jgi:hypothetical protein
VATQAPAPSRPADWLFRWYFPGGDVGRLREHEGACLTLADAVSAARQGLSWAGKDAAQSLHGAAGDALTKDMTNTDGDLAQLDAYLRDAARALEKHAQIKEEQQRQSRNLWIMTAVAGVAVALEAALAAGFLAVDVVLLDAAVAESGALAEATNGVAALLPKIVKSQVLYSAAYTAGQYIGKAIQLGDVHDPSTWASSWLEALDPNEYSASDVATALLAIPYGGAYTGVMKGLGLLDRSGTVPEETGAMAVAREAAIGMASKTAVSGTGAFWLGGKSIDDPGAWGEIGTSAALAAVGGGAAGKWSQWANRALNGSGLRGEDLARRVYNVPSDVAVAVTASPGASPPAPSFAVDGLSPPSPAQFEPPSADARATTPDPLPDTLWSGNAVDHPDELRLLQQRLMAHNLPARAGASWQETEGLIGWFKARHGLWTNPRSASDHSVDAATWRALLASPAGGQ